jgi:hypothetical protein
MPGFLLALFEPEPALYESLECLSLPYFLFAFA